MKTVSKEQIIKTVDNACEVMNYIKDNPGHVVVINGVSMTLENHLTKSKDYNLEMPFGEYTTALACEVSDILTYDDDYTTMDKYVTDFISYVNDVVIPKFEKYKVSAKYHYVYKLQYTSNDNSIDIIRYVEELGPVNTGVMFYREIENMNKGMQAVNREYFNKPMLKLNTETKELTATLWTYENKMRTAKNILRLYIESPLTYIISDLIIE